MNYEQTKELLKRNGQEQLLRFWDELDETGKEKLLRNIERLDFAVLENLKHPQNLSGEGSRLSPVKGLSVADIEANEQRFKTIGNEALRSGKIAGLLLAGGQGTRLGAEGPKGAFNMGVTRELSIFACQMNNILNDLRESGARPLLLVMTSEKNNEETQEFWKKNGYFGYDAEKVRFFVQDAAPCTDMNGKILPEEKDTPATSPNGNGGWFSSLKKSGLYEELKNGGAEWLNVYAVDNVLQRPFDPVFIGATLESGKACGAKCVRKNSPQEKVGVLCEKDGKAAVIEYYELTEETANARAADGSLEYSYGVILNYLFSLERLEETERETIPVHIVKKKIPYVNERGEKCEPQRENGLKFETLAVDLISFMGSVLPCEVRREKEFAPVKNATGADSVETARALLELNGVTL
ncbi:MAG: UTP--glucose-1-phosphate uridylyltransferase [Firmicutes bacterium]|nr:UTP--glucose-1-phosphate uridylyltransferase [Bacillota bacterium]